MPSAASPGASNVVSVERSALSSVWPAGAHVADRAAHVGRGHGRRRGRLLAGARAHRDVAVRGRLEHHDEVARERLVERPRRLVEQLADRPVAQGERAEGADGRLLGEAAAKLVAPEHAVGDVLRDHDRPDRPGLRWSAARSAASTRSGRRPTPCRSCATRPPAPRASARPRAPTRVAGMMSWRSRPTAARAS